jgi:threonine dehydrogenase-like Zn-dependent dehydrogenase
VKLTRRSTRETFQRALQLAEARSIDLAGLVTLRTPLTDGARAFAALVRRDGLKTVIEPGPRA